MQNTKIGAIQKWESSALTAALLFVIGCGESRPPMAPVRGTVTFEGNALPTGTITFLPQPTGPYASGQLNEDGTYELTTFDDGDGAVVGSHKVIISAVEIPNPDFPEARPLIPFEYSSEQTSGLNAEVQADQENEIDFQLQGNQK